MTKKLSSIPWYDKKALKCPLIWQKSSQVSLDMTKKLSSIPWYDKKALKYPLIWQKKLARVPWYDKKTLKCPLIWQKNSQVSIDMTNISQVSIDILAYLRLEKRFLQLFVLSNRNKIFVIFRGFRNIRLKRHKHFLGLYKQDKNTIQFETRTD